MKKFQVVEKIFKHPIQSFYFIPPFSFDFLHK